MHARPDSQAPGLGAVAEVGLLVGGGREDTLGPGQATDCASLLTLFSIAPLSDSTCFLESSNRA